MSLRKGTVVRTSSSMVELLGYPADMWVGRSFIDYVYPKDRASFTNTINGMGVDVDGIISDKGERLVVSATEISVVGWRCRLLFILSLLDSNGKSFAIILTVLKIQSEAASSCPSRVVDKLYAVCTHQPVSNGLCFRDTGH